MSKLNKILATNQKKPVKEQVRYNVPTYTAGGGVKRVEKKRKKKGWIIGGVITVSILGFLYIPGFFMKEEFNPLIVQTEIANSTALRNTVLRDYPNADFDNDGVSNSDEVNVYGTDPWLMDTDGDGASDLYEIKVANTDPTTQNDLLSQIQKNLDNEKGDHMETPFRNNNVLLWADNYYSKSHGGVIQTTTGYYFNEFTGYAQFAEKGYAYRYENNIHTLLEYREEEDVWKIAGNYDVEIYTDKLIEYEEISLFGLKFHPRRNFITDVIDFVLPQKGFITAKRITILDMEAKSGGVYANVQQIPFDTNDGFRFTRNNISLNDLAYVRSCVESDMCVLVSLYNSSIGEYIGVVYGYDYYGNLLIADKDNLSPVGKIYITEKAVRIINGSGQMESMGCFDFYGLGFSSDNTKISFFATAAGRINDFEYLPQMQPESEEVNPEQEEMNETGNSSENNQSDMNSSAGNSVSDNSVSVNNLPEEIMGETVNWDNVTIVTGGNNVEGNEQTSATGSTTGNSSSPDNNSTTSTSPSPTEESTSPGDSVSQNASTQSGQSINYDTEGQSEITNNGYTITGDSTEQDIISVLENISN